jgi:5-methylthioadenosine/S-adenosylhomocysteine deaminase
MAHTLTQKTSPQKTTWITNGIFVTQDKQRRVFKGHLRIENGRIAAFTKTAPPTKNSKKSGETVEVIDAAGNYIFPGFIQGHVHLCQTLFRNMADDLELMDWLRKRIWIFESAHTAETLATSTKLGIYELLSSGTTCVLDMGTVRHTESILKTATQLKMRGSFGKCLMDHPETTPEYLREPTEAALREAIELYRAWNGTADGRIRISFSPRFVVSCTEKLLLEVARLSRELGATVHTHASENLKEIQLVKELVHCENIEYLDQIGLTSERLVLAHCIWLKPNEQVLLKKSGTHVVHCPSSNLKLASGLAHVPQMRAMGINVALGADGAPCNNNLNMFQEMRLAALIHKPQHGPKTLPAEEVLDMATLSGARALQWESEIGSIEVGKKADLIAVDLSQPENQVEGIDGKGGLHLKNIASSLVYSAGREHLKWTMIDGNLLFSDGKVRGISTNSLKTEVRTAREFILKKCRSRMALE